MAINTTGFTQSKTIYVDFDQDRKPSLRDIGSDQIGANGAKEISFGFGSEDLSGHTVVLETKRVVDSGLKYAIASVYTDGTSTRYKVPLTSWFTTYRSALIMAVKVFNNNGVTIVDGEITTVDNDYLISVSDTFTLTVNYAPKATAVVPSFSASELELILAAIGGKLSVASGITVLQEADALPTVDETLNGSTYLKKNSDDTYTIYKVSGGVLVVIDDGRTLDSLHDVQATSPDDGDILRFDNGAWKNSDTLNIAESKITAVELEVDDLQSRMTTAESDIDGVQSKALSNEQDIEDIVIGVTIVGESVYASKDKSERNLIDLVHKTRTILGIDLADDILLGEFKTALGNATQSVAGLMSETDKARLDALHALLNEESANDVVDAINEILAIFENYPEGVDLVTALAGKVDKEVGKGLSANDYSDVEKNKVALSDSHRQATDNPHATTFAQLGSKPTTLSGYGITDAYTKAYIDSLKDMNGWKSELITTTPLTNGGTVALSTLQAFDTIKLFARNTSTNEIDTDSFETSVGLTVGYEYRLFDNADIKFVIGTPNCTFTTSAGYELRIIGQKYTELVASDVLYETGVSVKDKIDLKADKTYVDSQDLTKADKVVLTNLITNGDFSNGTTGWTAFRGTGTVTNNTYTLVGNTTNDFMAVFYDVPTNLTDKYYIASSLMTPDTVNQISISGGTILAFINNPTPNVWHFLSNIYTFPNLVGRHQLQLSHTSINGLTLNVKNNIRINLTAIFGAGNEPTKEQMNAIMTLKGGYFSTATLNVIDVMKLFAPKNQESWLTPTLTNATSTYIRYRKDTLGTTIIEGNITVTTAGTNFTLPTGYRPLFAFTQGGFTFNTNGTVVSSSTGLQYINTRFTGGA